MSKKRVEVGLNFCDLLRISELYCARFSQEKKRRRRHWAVSVSSSILSSTVYIFPYNNAFHIQEWKIFCISFLASILFHSSHFLYMQWYQMTRYGNYANECIGMRQKEKEGGYFISIYTYIVYLAIFSTTWDWSIISILEPSFDMALFQYL